MSTKYIDHRCKVNKNFPATVIDFAEYLETIKNKSEQTIKGYKSDLSTFFKFMILHRKKINDKSDLDGIDITKINDNFIKNITLTDLYAFMRFLDKEKSNSENTRARKVATLKSYFKYLHKKAKIIKENCAEELETPKINRKNPIVLNINQSKQLLESVDKDDKFYERDLAILTIFLNCGLRLSELCNIKLENIENNKLTVVGKGSKMRMVYLNEVCLKVVNDYLKVRDDSKCTEENKECLFLSNQHRQMAKVTVQTLVKKHLKDAELTDKKYTTHKLRGTYTTIMYNSGAKLRSLQVSLGHSSISTTQLYLSVDQQELEDMAEMNPLNNL